MPKVDILNDPNRDDYARHTEDIDHEESFEEMTEESSISFLFYSKISILYSRSVSGG